MRQIHLLLPLLLAAMASDGAAASGRKLVTCPLADPENAAAPGLEPIGTGMLVAASWAGDGSLALSDGRRFVPAGIVLPSTLHPPEDLAGRAATASGQVLDGRFMELRATSSDRHGRLMGQALLWKDGAPPLPLAVALLSAGAGYADPRALPACAGLLLAAEGQARVAKCGIFATDDAATPAEDVKRLEAQAGLFTVVQGRVRAIGVTRDKVYLNFGQRWREDFTVILPAKDFATILGDDLKPAFLRGARVRARGVVREDGGPAVFIGTAGELEILSTPKGARTGRGGNG